VSPAQHREVDLDTVVEQEERSERQSEKCDPHAASMTAPSHRC
jgi:hypothetical protein